MNPSLFATWISDHQEGDFDPQRYMILSVHLRAFTPHLHHVNLVMVDSVLIQLLLLVIVPPEPIAPLR